MSCQHLHGSINATKHPRRETSNDAGFWLVKEYFGLSVAETFKYWTTMETLLSILGLAGVLLASLF
ncbi:MAG: hypothetical protein JO151_00595 [Verrucomicrobia bacterium]|nr:hypothetical protein [Verrucomicrobiota bacterium]